MNSDQPGYRERICFGFGDFASVLYWQTFMAYLLFFYTDVFGITAAAAGTMILVSRLWDGVNDPMMGMIADRTETRWGKFRPYLLWICVPFAVMGVLTFTTPDLSYGGKLVWAYVTFIGLMMLYTAINIPYTAMLGVMSSDPLVRTSLSSIKFIFAYSAGVIASATLLPMVKAIGKGNDAKGWQLSFVIYGIAAIGFFLVAFAGTRERVRPPVGQKTSMGRDLRDLFSNRPWVILLVTTLTFILFVATRISVAAHYFKYYVGQQYIALPFVEGTYGYEELVSAFNAVGQLAAVVGVVLVSWFARLVGKKRAFIILYIVSIVSTAAFYLLRPEDISFMFILQIIGSATGGPLSPLIWAMYADTADYGEWSTGRRATGLVFSASTMSQKFGWAIGAAFAGWLLSVVGFQPHIEQSPEVQHGLVLLVSLIPAVLGIISLLPLLAYKLDEKTMRKIASDLEARRAKDKLAAAVG
jgi:GPH family glycoside/pentoside/hexuronide:cation symporter